MSFGENIKTADFKSEKHVPVIDIVHKDGEYITIGVKVGKEIAHPNTTEHHIAYIDVYFKADDGKFIQHVGKTEFSSHGESVEGPNKGDLYTDPNACFRIKPLKKGKIIAISYCNIHGLWESELSI